MSLTFEARLAQRQFDVELSMGPGERVAVLGGVIGWWSLQTAKDALPYVLVLAASAFVYIALADLVPGPGPFDRWNAGDDSAMDAAAVRGLAVFRGDGRCR